MAKKRKRKKKKRKTNMTRCAGVREKILKRETYECVQNNKQKQIV